METVAFDVHPLRGRRGRGGNDAAGKTGHAGRAEVRPAGFMYGPARPGTHPG
jgi:hypothetical protein